MNNSCVNQRSKPKPNQKKTNKRKFSKAKCAQTGSDLLLVQQELDKADRNKSAALAAKDKVNTFDNSIQKEPVSGCEKTSSNRGYEDGDRLFTSSLLRALKTLHEENGNKNNELLKKLFNSPFESGPKLPSLFGPPSEDFKNGTLIEDEESDDEEEFVEYVFTPRRYFIYSICEFCKIELTNNVVPCKECNMTYYCSVSDMEKDIGHKELCFALKQIGNSREGGYIYSNLSKLSPEDYRTCRVAIMSSCEQILQRLLLPFEKEIIIFPRNCMHCKEWRQDHLTACASCGQVSCRSPPEDFRISHQQWCKPFSVLRKLIIRQQKNDKVDPELPTEVLKDLPTCRSTMKAILKEINADHKDECSYAAITQVASAPLTVWYGLKLTQQLHKETLTVHLIGAEMQFEADVMEKWELFILHITPNVKELNIVFVGPELVPSGISIQPSIKNKVCATCHKNKRTVNLYFVEALYHDYCTTSSYKIPNLICFLNPGLHRITGFNNQDSWPETIKAVSKQRCPVLITSYTEYEAPLDFLRFLRSSDRSVGIVLPPTQNPFSSCRPERNFISDEMAPLIFKNYFLFIVD